MTEVQSFFGFINFYQWFIQDFLHVAKPLHQLTKKGEAWRWTEAKQEAFKELKQLIMLTPILVQPNQDTHFQLEWMLQGMPQEQFCPNCVKMTSGICLEEWRHILEGTKNMVEILNDHRNLMYFQTSQNLNCQQAHWSLCLVQLLSHPQARVTLSKTGHSLMLGRPSD